MFITQLLNCASSMMFLSWAVIRKKISRPATGMILMSLSAELASVRSSVERYKWEVNTGTLLFFDVHIQHSSEFAICHVVRHGNVSGRRIQ